MMIICISLTFSIEFVRALAPTSVTTYFPFGWRHTWKAMRIQDTDTKYIHISKMNEQKRNDIGQAIKQHAQNALSLSLSRRIQRIQNRLHCNKFLRARLSNNYWCTRNDIFVRFIWFERIPFGTCERLRKSWFGWCVTESRISVQMTVPIVR